MALKAQIKESIISMQKKDEEKLYPSFAVYEGENERMKY